MLVSFILFKVKYSIPNEFRASTLLTRIHFTQFLGILFVNYNSRIKILQHHHQERECF